jgi:hypothetical protein
VHIVQLLLPLYDPRGRRFPRSAYEEVLEKLTRKFGGVTSYARALARGLWKPARGSTQRDDVIVVEVMVARLDRRWWRRYRSDLEKRFRQDELVVRAYVMEKL